ncbi:MAG: DUF6492 family protein [Betaproteobacteria bacterium]|jgi:hypothetical protein
MEPFKNGGRESERFVIYCKTYKHHLPQVERLVRSIEKHNVDNIPVVISINPGDRKQEFVDALGTDITILDDREVYEINNVVGPLDGWRYQQVIKSNFYRTNIARNYLCIDSDIFFIKDFSLTDFMYADDIYTICHESKDMLEWMTLNGHDMDRVFYQSAQRLLRTAFGNNNYPLWDWGPSPFIWSCEVWREFNENYLAPTGLFFETFLKKFESTGVNFSEYVLYGEWLWANQTIKVIPRQPLSKIYHWKEQFVDEFNRGVRMSHLTQNYICVGIQSNWAASLGHSMLHEFMEN